MVVEERSRISRNFSDASDETTFDNILYSNYPDEVRMLHAHIEDLEKRLDVQQEELNIKSQTINNHQISYEEMQNLLSQGRIEKRRLEEQLNRYRGDLSAEENKINLIKTGRLKLEEELIEAQEIIAKEKKFRAELEKTKRKLEMNIKTLESDYSDILHGKVQIEEVVSKKDDKILKLQCYCETVNIEKSKLNRKFEEIKQELDNKIEENDKEHDLRIKAEKSRFTLENEIDELKIIIQNVQQSASINIDTVRRRDGELEKIRHDIQDLTNRNDETIEQLKRKHDSAIEEMARQIDHVKQEKMKATKDLEKYKSELIKNHSEFDCLLKEKDKQNILNVQLEERVEEYRRQVQEMTSTIDEMHSEKKKCDQDVKGLSRMIDENSSSISTLLKAKEQLQAHLEHARHKIDEESRSRITLAAELRTLGTELDGTKCQLDDELENKAEMERDLIKLSSSLEQWKKRYENERFDHMRNVEDVRSTLENKCHQLDDQLDQTMSKVISLERMKEKLQSEIEELLSDLDKSNANIYQLERKHKRFDKLIEEWKQKCENTSTELAASQNESKYMASEIVKSNEQYAEAQEQIESLRRENRNLSEEIKSLMDQISENARSSLEFDIEKKRLEKEKEEVKIAIDDALSSKDEADAKVRRLELDIGNLEIEHIAALKEQEEDMLIAKRQVERQMEALQSCLDSESLARKELIGQIDNLQTIITDLTIELEHKAGHIVQLDNIISENQDRFEEYEKQLQDEAHCTELAQEGELSANRKVRALQTEIDNLKLNLNSSFKTIDKLESDLNHQKLSNNDLSNQNSALNNRISHNESLRLKIQLDLEEKVTQLHACEERCTRLNSDVCKLTEKLKIEEEHALEFEMKASNLDILLSEANDRADSARSEAMKFTKSTIEGLEDQLQHKSGQYALLSISCEELKRSLNKCERKLKEVQNQLVISNQHNDQLIAQNEGLQAKTKLTRKQAEQAEEEAAQSIARFKAMAEDLERSESRADRAENMINKYRAASRFGVATGIPMSTAQIDVRDVSFRDHRSTTRNL